jgi:hypothetical protein
VSADVLEHFQGELAKALAAFDAAEEVGGALGVSVDTALLDVRELVRQGIVRAEGSTKDRRYRLQHGGQ